MIKKIIGIIWKKLTPAARVRIIRSTQKKFTVSAAAVVTNEKGEVLLLDHVFRPFSNWGIPGGFIEAGEQPEKAVIREIREETGLQLKNVRLVRARTAGRHVEILFRAEASGRAEAKSREINRAEWFRSDRMPEEMSRKQKSDVLELLEGEENKFAA
ncbi:MAG TPA: NUDIX hydrolase [Pyrinomonadaceae bacterium]|nr:NUDIX hydrolase [Pyrinomonadaceae bacterium]